LLLSCLKRSWRDSSALRIVSFNGSCRGMALCPVPLLQATGGARLLLLVHWCCCCLHGVGTVLCWPGLEHRVALLRGYCSQTAAVPGLAVCAAPGARDVPTTVRWVVLTQYCRRRPRGEERACTSADRAVP
jgi:hypothetical protein